MEREILLQNIPRQEFELDLSEHTLSDDEIHLRGVSIFVSITILRSYFDIEMIFCFRIVKHPQSPENLSAPKIQRIRIEVVGLVSI